MREAIVLAFVLFVVLGCGYQSTSSEDKNNITPEATLSFSKKILPEKISVNFPTVLKDTIDSSSDSGDSKLENKIENNIQQLQKDIYKVEDIIKIAELNIILLEQVMPEILEKCNDMEHCLFKERELSFLLDEKIITSIDNVLDEKKRDFLDINNTIIYLGDIEFFKYENQKYEYELNFNMLNSSFVKESNSIKEQRQILKWSSSKDNVKITYLYTSDMDRLVTTVRYFINSDDGNELMYLSDKNDTNVSIENTTLVVKNSDYNRSYSLTSNTTIQQLTSNEINSSHFSTNIGLDNNSTNLLLSYKDLTIEETNIVNDSYELLDMVVVESKPIVVVGPGLSEYSSQISNLNRVVEDLTLIAFEVNGEFLSSGDYILLRPTTDTTELSLGDVFTQSIGSFVVIEGNGKPQGSLYNREFKDLLNELIIVKIINSQETTEISEFIVIENKPQLNIIKK